MTARFARLLVALAVLVAVAPAVLVSAVPTVVPPQTSRAFAFISLLAGMLSLALLYRFSIRLTKALYTPTRLVVLLAAGTLVCSICYFYLIDRVSMHAFASDGTEYGYIYVPLWLRGDVAESVAKAGGVPQAIEKNGPRGFERALKAMPGIGVVRPLTTLILLLLFLAVQIGTVAALAIVAMQPQRVGGRGLGRQFQVAVTFPGEFRPIIEKVVEALATTLDRNDIFYDMWYQVELAVPDLDQVLRVVYRDESDLLVVFLGRGYDTKKWCRIEWRAIWDAIILRRRERNDVFLIRMDDVNLADIASTDGYFDVAGMPPTDIAAAIAKRLSLPHVW